MVHEEQVVLGNDVSVKCNIPSFQADFVSVVSWQDSEGVQHPANYNEGNKAAGALEHPPALITIVLYISCGEDTGNLAAFVFFVILFCMRYSELYY